MDRQRHWEAVYRDRRPEDLSWFQPHSETSMDLIESWLPHRDAPILDVGGGASGLADDLLRDGYHDVTVLDVSPSALALVRERLGPDRAGLSLVAGDVLLSDLPPASVALWHDRAVFHFLTNPSDRHRYLSRLRGCLSPGGLALVATFAEDGPTRCSGLDVVRYSVSGLDAVFGPEFHLLESRREEHRTPGGAVQPFNYCLWRYSPRETIPPERSG